MEARDKLIEDKIFTLNNISGWNMSKVFRNKRILFITLIRLPLITIGYASTIFSQKSSFFFYNRQKMYKQFVPNVLQEKRGNEKVRERCTKTKDVIKKIYSHSLMR